MALVGYIAAALSAVFNGSYTSPYKLERVATLQLHPILFMLYVSIGVFLSSMLSIAILPLNPKVLDDDSVGTKFAFSWFGIIAGFLLVIAVACSFLAVEKIGVALSQGVFGGTAILVSYIWGTVVFNQPPTDVVLSVFGILLLMVGVAGIAMNKQIALRVLQIRGLTVIEGTTVSERSEKQSLAATVKNPIGMYTTDSMEDTTPSFEMRVNSDSPYAAEEGRTGKRAFASSDGIEAEKRADVGHDSSSFPAAVDSAREADSSRRSTVPVLLSAEEGSNVTEGIAWAFAVGFSGGSILAPSNYAAPSASGLAFLPSFGLGAIILSPIVAACWFYVEDKGLPPLHLKETLPVGILSGFLFNISNVLSIVAIPQLGYGVAYPILQCALFVAGLWGIFVFNEFVGLEIATFFISGAVLISGAVCIAVAS